MPSVDTGELKNTWRPNFQQAILKCSRGAGAHVCTEPTFEMQEVKLWPWTRTQDLVSKKLLDFFFSKIWVWVKYYRLPCLWDGATPETGTWNPSQFLGASSPSMSSSCLRRSCLWRGDVAGDVASSVQVAFHNVTLRHENKALAISQISQHLGRDFSVTQSADFVCEFPCWLIFLLIIFKTDMSRNSLKKTSCSAQKAITFLYTDYAIDQVF